MLRHKHTHKHLERGSEPKASCGGTEDSRSERSNIAEKSLARGSWQNFILVGRRDCGALSSVSHAFVKVRFFGKCKLVGVIYGERRKYDGTQ